MTRRWLLQLNYSYGISNGYQNDPYRIVSVVDPTSGEPTDYLYENRPGKRTRQSVYLDNKFIYGPTVTDLSARYYTDSWGIQAETAELSERRESCALALCGTKCALVPADGREFLPPLPCRRSGRAGLCQFGFAPGQVHGTDLWRWRWVSTLPAQVEIYVRGAYYKQRGDGHPADAIGQLKNQNLFSGVKAGWVMVGYSWDFH